MGGTALTLAKEQDLGIALASGVILPPVITRADQPRRRTSEAHRIERTFRFKNFREALSFVQKVGELAKAQGHHPDISFGWGYATVSLRTKKIKGLHENDFIMAAKIDRLAEAAAAGV